MGSDLGPKISVTKLGAACRQIETAIDLWFHDGDPVSIHTLTGAANRLVLDLLGHQGDTTALFDMAYVVQGREKEYKVWLRRTETFFKHALKDPNDVLDFYPSATEFYLLDAIHGYQKLDSRTNLFMLMFSIHFALLYPAEYSGSASPVIQKLLAVDGVRELQKHELFEVLREELSAFFR